MLHRHLSSASNQINIYERRYLGDGKYFQRGSCKGIAVGDDFVTYTNSAVTLTVVRIDRIYDAKGVFNNPEDAKDAIYEAEMIDNQFTADGYNYKPLSNV